MWKRESDWNASSSHVIICSFVKLAIRIIYCQGRRVIGLETIAKNISVVFKEGFKRNRERESVGDGDFGIEAKHPQHWVDTR